MSLVRMFVIAALTAGITLALVAALGGFAGERGAQAQQESGSAAEVRIAARALSDGRFEVGLQQRQQHTWSDVELPKARFLSQDHEVDRWHFSSPLRLTRAAGDTRQETMPSAMPGGGTDAGLVCIVTHGRAADRFWTLFDLHAQRAARSVGLDLRIAHHADGAEQAAAISQCVTDDAAAIGSTLADPDSVLPALQAAGRAGVQIVTFNSGVDFASEAGSRFHIALDDRTAGELAGEQFNQLNQANQADAGTVLCVIHEQDNVGLTDRCDGLEATYSGAVEILQLDESLDDHGRANRIAERLRAAEPPTGILTLNGNVLAAAVSALDAVDQRPDQRPVIGSVGFDTRLLARHLPLARETLRFMIDPTSASQGFLTAMVLHRVIDSVGNTPNPAAALLQATTVADLQPRVFDMSAVLSNPEVLQWLAGLADRNQPQQPQPPN